MNFETFKVQVLDSAQSPDFDKFLYLVSENPTFLDRWNELKTKSADSIIHLAARSGCVEIIKFYHELGNQTILELKNLDGKTPLHFAAHSSQLNCVNYLLQCGVHVDALKRADWTPLMLACTKPDLGVVRALLDHGANIYILNKDGWNAFHIASREGNCEIIKCFLELDPLVWNTKSKNGRTPLHTAALHGHLNVVKVLLKVGSNINARDSCGTTPLMDAVSGKQNHVVQYLIEEGASLTETDKLGKNVLHFAAEADNVFCIEHFVKSIFLSIDSQTLHGLTALHVACKENHLKSVTLLISLGADSTLTDKRGRSALDYASDEDICTYFHNLKK